MMRIFIRNESAGEKAAKIKSLNCANCMLRLLTCKEVKKMPTKILTEAQTFVIFHYSSAKRLHQSLRKSDLMNDE